MKRRGRPPYPGILTPREWEVLDLLRTGLTNEQIAQQLGISLQGAKFHVSEILGKLQLPDRRAAARWEAPRHSRIAPAIAALTFVPRKLGGIAQWRPVQFVLAVGAAMSLAVVIGAVVVAAVLIARSDRGDGNGRFVVGSNVDLPLTLDGDRLGVSALDGAAPTTITDAGSFSSVHYDKAGRLIYVDLSGAHPGFYRVESGKPRLVVPTPGLAAYSAGMAEWSPDGSRAAWVAPDGRLRTATPDGATVMRGPGDLVRFSWSPDNRRVIAQSRAGQSGWVIDTRDGTTTATRASWPAIVSSAGDVAWVEIDGGTFTGTTLLSKEGGSGSRVLGSSAVPPEEYFPTLTFSPDSDWLASDTIAVPSAVTIVDMRSGAQFAPSCAACLPARGFDPVWSPDGSSLAWSQDGHVVLARTGDWAGSIVADGVPVAWSPDGSQIAYTRVVGDPGSSSTLYVRPILGGDETSVVTIEDTRGVADQLAWSPDGTKIVVPLQAPESSKVYSFDPKTAGVDALPVPAPTTEARMSPAGDAFYDGLVVRRTDGSAPVPVSGVVADWSRDGQRLLIAGRGPNGGPGLSVLDLRTRAQTSLLDGNVQDAAWSPDERRIAFVRDQKLGVLDVTSGKVTMVAPQITAMFLSAMLGGGYVGWSPDGRQIAVGEWRAEGRATNGVADVYLVDVSSGQATKLAASGSAERYFTFSPDGHNLAYLDNESSVTVLDIATKKQRVIQQSGGANFAWSGDDGIILDTQRGIVLMQLDGTSRLLVADTGGCRHSLMGWSGTRLIFTELCTHRGL